MSLQIEESIALFGVILFIGFFAKIIFNRFKVPNVITLLLIGLILGPISGILSTEQLSNYAVLFSPIALIIVLFQGGLNMRISSFVKDSPKAFMLGLVNVLASVIFVALAGYYFLGWDILKGAVLGAIIGGTSSSIVVPLVSGGNVRKVVSNLLSLESISTDVLCIVIAIALIGMYTTSTPNISGEYISGFLGSVAKDVFTAFSTGTVIGLIGALFWAWVLKKTDMEFDYMLTLGFLFILYYVSESLDGNGAITSLVFGLLMGNIRYVSNMLRTDKFMIENKLIKEFHHEVYFFISTFFMVYLGVIINLSNWYYFVIGGLLALALVALRALLVPILLKRTGKYKSNEIKLISYVSSRGLAAAVLAPMPAVYGMTGTEMFSDIVFAVILVSVLATSLGYIFAEGNQEEKSNHKSQQENKSENKKPKNGENSNKKVKENQKPAESKTG